MNECEKIKKIIKLSQEKNRCVCAWGTGYVAKGPGYQMLKEQNIRIDFFFDSDVSKCGKEIIDGIKCRSSKDLVKDAIFYILIATVDSYSIKRKLIDLGIKHIVMYDELCAVSAEGYFDFQKKKQIAVYSCIVNGYDEIINPISVSEKCDYYLITDEKKENDNIYKYIDIKNIITTENQNPTRLNRYCKINAHKIFPEYKYSIYFDGCARLKASIADQIYRIPDNGIMMLMKTKATVYSTIYKNIVHGRDDERVLIQQGQKYWNEGLPDDFGILHPGIMVREHNNIVCRKIMETWWNEIENYSYRDMISLPYALWSNGLLAEDIGIIISDDEVWNEEWGIWYGPHKYPRNQRKFELKR